MVKKGKIATLSIVAIAVTLVIGGTIMTVQNQNLFTDGVKREKKKDIEEYIKSLNPKIETVQIDWDQTQWDQIGNGTPQGGGDIVQVYGGFNNMAKSSWSVIIRIEDEKILINSIGIGSPLRIGGELFE